MIIRTLLNFDGVRSNFKSEDEMCMFFEQLLTKILNIIDINSYTVSYIIKKKIKIRKQLNNLVSSYYHEVFINYIFL